MPPINREQLLAACKRGIVPVECPALGGQVYVQALTGKEVASVYASLTDSVEITQGIVTLSVCDEAGTRVFTLDDRAELFDKPFGALADLQSAAMTANRMTKEDRDAARKA